MKIKFAAIASSADYYTFNGESITAHYGDREETYDLSPFSEGGTFVGADPVAPGVTAIRGARRVNGELEVVLAQQVIAGQYPGQKAHWRDSPVMDVADYDPKTCYVVPTGMAGIEDYEIVKGVDVAGSAGWTVRKIEMQE
ncbi:hypothetical protein ACSEE7_12655 [Halomonas cupida]|uniref:hypothetical protein n=1 Tax=Halomonas cupida TaxID=44933 RepID=UPI003EF91F56